VRLRLLAGMLSAVALASPGLAAAKTIRVQGDAGFARAEQALKRSGGTIVLRPALYRKLVIGPRSRRPLRIVGTRGVRVQSLIFTRTRHVSFGRVRIGPIDRNALVQVRRSHDVVLHHLAVSAHRTRFSASVLVPDSRRVTIRDSNFQHCGDHVRRFVYCVTLYRWTHDVLLDRNRFHDCYGCDFVHGRFGSDLTLRGNRFERALPCSLGRYRCGHQDLVQLFSGRRLSVVGNHFGVYREGGAQLYLTNDVDHAAIVNNVFVGRDRRVPGYHARMGIVIGSNASRRLPHHAKILNNTILTGWMRRDGYSGSIRMSSRYGGVPRWKRPIVANNVIALLETAGRVCLAAQQFLQNVVVRGRTCSDYNHLGAAGVDGYGRPRLGSIVIDGANRALAPATDATGRRRRGAPDIGALEYRGG
jgi:Right handed beta helix region